MREELSLGVDLGGTKTEAAILRRFGDHLERFEVLVRERVPTPAAEGYDAVLQSSRDLVSAAARQAGVALASIPIGVGMPGAVARRTGLVKNSNTVCLNGRAFRQDLSRALGCAVRFENDANCFALAEAHLGAAREHREGVVFGAILGTGVGGGIIIAGRVWPGPQQLAGEWGHHAVGPWVRVPCAPGRGSDFTSDHGLSERPVCYCGRTGCLELYLSGRAVEADYVRRGGAALPLKRITELTSDPIAVAAVDEMLEAFGRGLANLIDILDPSIVVLGGGVSNIDSLYREGRERVARYVFNDELLTPIVRHELGDSAGVLGAALLAG